MLLNVSITRNEGEQQPWSRGAGGSEVGVEWSQDTRGDSNASGGDNVDVDAIGCTCPEKNIGVVEAAFSALSSAWQTQEKKLAATAKEPSKPII
ncbi:hypothetical protein PIB30_002594 [Stylosanthes scabra]|uniref:Uncharacterized protein n=1 Tax=Stylosanthes scabra TaxID=79078 RepID=A0ABU6Z2A7_9FABA|nr:hypothetical protein [Stylosanthes scabra]